MTKKILISYYSLSGTTKRLAENIAQKNNSDLFEIKVPTETFSSDMFATNDIFKKQLANNNWPQVNILDNYKEYDLILIGTPVWSGMPSSPIASFLNKIQDFTGNIACFHTSVGQFDQTFDSTLKKWAGNLYYLGSCEGDQKINEWIQK